MSRKEHSAAAKKIKNDYEHLILVPLDNDLNSVMEDLFNRHPLRGFGAIHLASALVFANSARMNIGMVIKRGAIFILRIFINNSRSIFHDIFATQPEFIPTARLYN